MRYTVILVPADQGWISALVPAMPGCFSQGHSRERALANIREAMTGWLETEAEYGRGPISETPELVLDSVAEAFHTIEEMRAEGELPAE